MQTFNNTLDDIKNRSAFTLGIDLNTDNPDSNNSEGANLLKAARDAVVFEVEAIDEDYKSNPSDLHWALERISENVGELMDSVPSVMTRTIWETYVELAAYQVSLYDDYYGADGADDMTRVASITLCLIAEEVGRSLLDELIEAVEADAGDE